MIEIPALSLVVLVGVSGSGKSTFAARHFGPFETVSSDFCRGLVSNDPNDQSATSEAFDVLRYIVGKRLRAGKLTVIDATNVQPAARRELVALARDHDVLPVAIILDVPAGVAIERNAARPDRSFGAVVVKRQLDQLRRSARNLAKEGFRGVHRLSTAAEVEIAEIRRVPLRCDRRDLTGPFDVVGDVHGCLAELVELLAALGYTVAHDDIGRPVDAVHPDGRTAAFVGDLVDRGPDSPGVLRLVMGMVRAGHALLVPGNHDDRLVRALRGRDVKRTHGLAETLEQLDAEPAEFRAQVLDFLDPLVTHLVLDGGKLVLAHAGLKEEYQGRASGRVREFALYGQTTGETDEYGLPVRYPWAQEYRGTATVLYGHTPTVEPAWLNRTMCLDTGCVFGGKLTALRYPEKELVSVPAHRTYYEPVRPLAASANLLGEPERRDGHGLELDDVLGKRGVQTALRGRITVREENSAGALEVMSRFAVDPRWLMYLPPTMAPCSGPAPSSELLEHPAQAFAAHRADGVTAAVCEEKHMGSRAIVLVCRDAEAAAARFGVADGLRGMAYTRTGRQFFDDARTAAEVLAAAQRRGLPVDALVVRTQRRLGNVEAFAQAYRRFVWPVAGLAGIKVAPFQLLATEGVNRAAEHDHLWHLRLAERLAAASALMQPTRHLVVDLADERSMGEAERWWLDLTGAGGEGMVVKPLAFAGAEARRKAQPGIKVRGREYLRLIYGPDYTEPEQFERLRQRRLGHKQSLALREHALGMEALDRLVRAEPLWRIHEAVFAVLALESEPVDPRL
jgi:protein phosphatase